ncbi:MAG: DUF983 domain-containing protein [Candidatus Rokuibacteriota bacterium]
MDVGRARRVLARGLRLRCPRCGVGALFRGLFRMDARCPACQLVFEREPGYFVGAIYLNYGMTVLILMPSYVGLNAWLPVGLGLQLLLGGAFVVLFPLWFFRYSRSLWLSLDYFIDPVGPSAHGGAGRRAGPPEAP